MILRAVHTPVFAKLDLRLLHRHFDHGDDVITLEWDHRRVFKRLIVELHSETVFIKALVYTLNRRKMVRPLAVILVVVKKDVFHEVQFEDALLVTLTHYEYHEGEEAAILKLRNN